jgi:hypothetical protein
MPAAVPPPRYESTVSPETRPGYGTGTAAGTLGVRNQTGLEEAFVGGVGISNDSQQTALTNARATLDRPEDNGQNPMFPQYRRNFVPAGGSLTEEYVEPRVKPIDLSEEERNRLKLGNAYTPTIDSPGEGNGIDPNALRSVQSQATQVLQAGPVNKDNPANAEHQNTDSTNAVNNVGGVRRFKLGVGSGAATGASPEAARGQFPRPPT